MIETEDADYQILGNEFAVILRNINKTCDYFCVPSEVYSRNKKKFKIIGISFEFFINGEINTISFDKASEIAEIPASFALSSMVSFFLPSSTKRVCGTSFRHRNKPSVFIDGENRFVSITGKRNITNNHPLEIINFEFYRANLMFKETTRIIGDGVFESNKKIKTVVFPPSVEIIKASSFLQCSNLTRIIFKGKSNLKKIESCAFSYTSISKVIFPSSLEEIEKFAFFMYKSLRSVSFQSNSVQGKIGL